MSTLTVAQFREHLETDLLDAALQRYIDDAEGEIVKVAGALATETDQVKHAIAANSIFLKRSASTVTTVVEELEGPGGTLTPTTLDPTDYRLVGDYQLMRLSSGVNPRATWADFVTIIYVPDSDAAMRLGVTVDLVKLAVQFSGLDSEKVGDWSASQSKHEAKKAEALKRLTAGFPFA